MIDILVSVLLSLGNVGAFSILAVGIVMIYRASKVLNLAHGAMVMFPPYVVLILNSGGAPMSQRILACVVPAAAVGPMVATILQRRVARPVRLAAGTVASLAALGLLVTVAGAGLPLIPSLIVGIAAGGALGYLVERIFVRGLRAQGPTAQTVGTVAALGIVVAVSAKIFGTQAQNGAKVFPEGGINISASFIPYGQIGLFFLSMALTYALILLFKKTDLGLIMRGTAENRRAAALMGADPDKITALTWVMGGVLAGLSGILLASVTNLHPYVLSLQALPAFVAALLGGMASLFGAVVGAAIVGVTFSVVPALGFLEKLQGGPQLFLALAAVAAMVTRGQKIVGGDVRSESIAAAGKKQVRGLGGLAEGKRPLTILGIILFLGFPFLPFVSFDIVSNMNRAAANTMIATSLVILIGWVGQISLGHAALV
ncbi:MAG TPA: branched-chain amino acid ABC transporter permease, partial [Actinomycetota bacterium]|nr:branched-chain amino acid ABC transporter permease [Actinomycetota bacterium]